MFGEISPDLFAAHGVVLHFQVIALLYRRNLMAYRAFLLAISSNNQSNYDITNYKSLD